MARISIPRNGKSPMEFDGERLAFIAPESGLPLGALEWRLTLYRVHAGGYVFASQLELAAPARMTLSSAMDFNSAHELVAYLHNGDHHCVEPPMTLIAEAAKVDAGLRSRLKPACLADGRPAVRPDYEYINHPGGNAADVYIPVEPAANAATRASADDDSLDADVELAFA